MKTTRGFYRGLWVALLLGVVWAPIAIAQPAADFFADYQRAQIGENVNFLDLSTGTIVSRDWDFGDGVTLNTTDIIVSHAYFPTNPLPVLYDVMLTVSEASASNSLTRTDYIEILSPPFARFTANTFVGPSPLTVNFTDGSVGGALTVTAWAWDFDDGGATSTDQNPSHTFNDDGTYDVTLTVTFSDASTDSETREVVVGTGEEQQPTASFLFEDRIRNEQCLLPLNDWVPVLRWNMLWDNEDEPAPRLLTRMEFHIKPDPIAGDRLYDFSSSLHPWDILEFAIFRENSAVDDTPNYEELSPADGIISSIVAPFPRAVFDPYGVLVDNGADINTAVPFGEGDWGMRFSLQVAQFNMTTAADPGNTYWLAVRTSATWHNALTLAVDLTDIDYQDITDPTAPLPPPTDDEGAPIDTVDPLDEAILDAKNAYLASFTVWDTTGGPSTNRDRSYTNAWNWPMRVYSPMAEYRRPRWDVAGQAYDFVTGEWLETRKVSSLDNWFEVIGLNLHGTPAPHWDNVVSLHEVNVILTDEGADPFGPPGSGGFNPTEGLETFTDQWWRLNNDDNTSVGVDFGFNGLWVFHDTDNDGIFDPPSQTTSQGVNYSGGDYPMIPMRGDAEFLTDDEPIDINPGLPEWQFVPFPPGGGPPWWKIKLKFLSGRRRPTEDTAPTGYLEPTPEVDIHTNSSSWCDYFVVVRPDSGYADVSQTPGDGTGMTIGADFKAFIEPRRFNANIGAEDGGIYVSTMIPSEFLPWQNDPLWGASEPWFPQRTTNQATTKPTRTGGDISDLIITYETNNLYARRTRHWYGASGHAVGWGSVRGVVSNTLFPEQTWWDGWLDPFGLQAGQFQDFHSVSTERWYSGIAGVDDSSFDSVHFPYETVPFFNADFDVPPLGPRSNFYTSIPAQPGLPQLSTWPGVLGTGQYPRESDWPVASKNTRYLKQHIDPLSLPTAMLGINLAGADDVVVNQFSRLRLQQFTVALWGPDFTPSDLLALDENGTSSNSGVVLVEDSSGDGVFGNGLNPVDPLAVDQTVTLNDLAWQTVPQYVDVSGDGIADDMNGDGELTEDDKAWVLKFKIADTWDVPVIDGAGGNVGSAKSLRDDSRDAGSFLVANGQRSGGSATRQATLLADGSGSLAGDSSDGASDGLVVSKRGKGYWRQEPQTVDVSKTTSTKAIGPSGNAGPDLFIAVRTSDTLSRFEQFRAFVPAHAPARLPAEAPGTETRAGLEFTPQNPVSFGVYKKFHPEEGPVQEFFGPKFAQGSLPDELYEPYLFGFDLIEANVYCDIQDLAGTGQSVFPDSGDMPVLGIDLSTNRGNDVGTLASGMAGVGGASAFTVVGAAWAAGAYTGCFLIDNQYESYEITGNNANTLFLRSGTPRNGAWFIACNPTFFEQLIVEFYDVDQDGAFNMLEDLLPFNIDQTVSGVALYRDNDLNPANTNGVFDAGIDIPVPLDYPPFQIGQVGEPENQVMFVFSTPGTDNVPQALENQTRHRQWIPDSLGTALTAAEKGPDFFVVIRTSSEADLGDDFRVAVVSLGPNTPTEPDPDTWPPPPLTQAGEFDLFSEFPWGYRGVGLITFFSAVSQPEAYYAKGVPEVDASGFNWVRSQVNKSEQTGTLTLSEKIPTLEDVIISSVAPTTLPKITPVGGFSITINGSGFGTTPAVVLDGFTLTVTAASDTQIAAVIPGGVTLDANSDLIVILSVTNPSTSESGTYDSFTISTADPSLTPSVSTVSPDRGGASDFPVAILGANFDDPLVFFGVTSVPVQSWTPTRIDVGFPIGGIAVTGALDVTVRNQSTSLSDILIDGFTYVNPPSGTPKASCFIATAAYGTPLAGDLDTFRAFRDRVLLKSAAGTALVDVYYTTSPAIADYAAAHPWFAGALRVVLTPVAWTLRQPVWALAMLLLAFGAGRVVRRRTRAYRARA